MQPTSTSEDKIRTIRKCLAPASVGLFSIAALLTIIFTFTLSPILFQIGGSAVVLGIAFVGVSWNISRIHSGSAAVRILAKVSIVVDLVAAVVISLGVIKLPSIVYKNCYGIYERGSYSQNYQQCYENAMTFNLIFNKILYTAVILAFAGEIVGRYLTYETTKKLTNITRWTAVTLTTLLSLAIIICRLFEISLEDPIAHVAVCALTLCALTIVTTPILLRVEKEYTKQSAPLTINPATPTQAPTVPATNTSQNPPTML